MGNKFIGQNINNESKNILEICEAIIHELRFIQNYSGFSSFNLIHIFLISFLNSKVIIS